MLARSRQRRAPPPWRRIIRPNPITVILPLAVGSGLDLVARLYGEKLQEKLGKPVVVENRPGAAG